MRKFSVKLLITGLFFLTTQLSAEQLQFSADSVSKSLPGDPASSAIKQVNGEKQIVSVMLPRHASIKDLKMGDLIYLRSGVYRVKTVTTNSDGSVNIEVEHTNLTVSKTHRNFSQYNQSGVY
jgi:hypothetical protein